MPEIKFYKHNGYFFAMDGNKQFFESTLLGRINGQPKYSFSGLTGINYTNLTTTTWLFKDFKKLSNLIDNYFQGTKPTQQSNEPILVSSSNY
jgi:hypothetical protein